MMGQRENWDEIYSAGEQKNKAPFDEVVSFVFKHSPRDRRNDQISLMELGCGVGNNLKFFAREGYKCFGIDVSPVAVQEANYGAIRNEQYRVEQADFRKLPYGDDVFDLVIDRASLWYVDRQDARRSIYEVHRVLLPGGKFLFTPCKDNVDERTGYIRFDTAKQALSFFNEELWKIVSFERVDIWDISRGYKIKSSHFRIVAEKK